MWDRLSAIFIDSVKGNKWTAAPVRNVTALVSSVNRRRIDITESNGLNRVKSFLVSSASANFGCVFTVDLSIWHCIQTLLCQRRDLLFPANKNKSTSFSEISSSLNYGLCQRMSKQRDITKPRRQSTFDIHFPFSLSLSASLCLCVYKCTNIHLKSSFPLLFWMNLHWFLWVMS